MNYLSSSPSSGGAFSSNGPSYSQPSAGGSARPVNNTPTNRFGGASKPSRDPNQGPGDGPGSGGGESNGGNGSSQAAAAKPTAAQIAAQEAAAQTEREGQPDYIYAELIREQLDHFNQYGRPLQQMLADNILDPEKAAKLRGESLNMADNAVNNSFDAADRRHETMLSRYGQSMTPEDKALQSQRSDVQRSAARVDARNQVRGANRDREMTLLGG